MIIIYNCIEKQLIYYPDLTSPSVNLSKGFSCNSATIDKLNMIDDKTQHLSDECIGLLLLYIFCNGN